MKIAKDIYYENFTCLFETLKEEYFKRNKKIPDISVRSFDGFLNIHFEDFKDFLYQGEEFLKSYEQSYKFTDKQLYLAIACSGKGSSEKLNDYFKLWKQLKDYDISKYTLGYEYKLRFKNLNYYAGVLKFDFKDINEILNILNEERNNSFIFSSYSLDLNTQENTKMLFDMLFEEEIPKIGIELFDYSRLFECMKVGETIINTAFDGEGIVLNILNKESYQAYNYSD